MNTANLIAFVIFVLGWLGFVGSVVVFFYHTAVANFRWLQSRPTLQTVVQKIFWFRRGFAGLRDTWNDVPAATASHRRKAIEAMIAAAGFWLIGLSGWLIGFEWGGWSNLTNS